MQNYLDEIIRLQKDGQARGIPSICSAHSWVLRAAMQNAAQTGLPLLIEATCNQVNQFGGYTGMTPKDFVAYVRGIADANGFPFEKIILGGDHLGPSVWQDESADSAMRKAETLARDYVASGFTKIHLDCSMKLQDDPGEMLDPEVSAKRATRLAKVAEIAAAEQCSALRYVIGTEVPVPGGAVGHEETVSVTNVEDVRQTIEVTHEAFCRDGLASAWERVIAVVVQPGIEFGNDFVFDYQPDMAGELSHFIATRPMIYEAHSTDYQTREALRNLVRDHFAILKVGPALTFAFREAVFALAMMENELFPSNERSNILVVLDNVMQKKSEHWRKYYHGDETERAFKRRYSLSDRIRYYWLEPEVQLALKKLLLNLSQVSLPMALSRQYAPDVLLNINERGCVVRSERIILLKITKVLEDYHLACAGDRL